MYLTGGRIIDQEGKIISSIIAGENIIFEFDYTSKTMLRDVDVTLTIYNQFGVAVTNSTTALTIGKIDNLGLKGHIKFIVKKSPFPLGNYRVAIAIHSSGQLVDHINNALVFSVDSSIFFPSLRTPNNKYCAIMIDHSWEHEKLL